MYTPYPQFIFILILFLLNPLPLFAQVNVKNWQGEWGNLVKDGNGINGAILKISDCDAATQNCNFSFQIGKPISINRCQHHGKLKFTTNTTAESLLISHFKNDDQCIVHFSLEESLEKPFIKGDIEGENCKQFCTEEVYTAETYSLHSRANYPDNRWEDCFLDSRKAREILCEDHGLIEFDRKNTELQSLPNSDISWADDQKWIEEIISKCESDIDIRACLSKEYEFRISSIEKRLTEEESKINLVENPAEAARVISMVEGVYKHRFENANIDGEKYTSENILELVPVTDDSLYFKIHLEFYNGHECNLSGTAQLRKNGNFIFYKKSPLNPDNYIRLQIKPTTEGIILRDDGTERNFQCGARGGYDETTFSKKGRRVIKYMNRIKLSSDYKNALEEAGIK